MPRFMMFVFFSGFLAWMTFSSLEVSAQQPAKQPSPKQCLSCKKEVPGTSKVGDTCPHCGVRWNLDFSPREFNADDILRRAKETPPKPPSRTISPDKVIDGKSSKTSKTPPAKDATTVNNPPVPQYRWETIPGSDQLTLVTEKGKVGVYDRKTETYRKYDSEGRLSEPVPPPWKKPDTIEKDKRSPAVVGNDASRLPQPLPTETQYDFYPVYFWCAVAGAVPLVLIIAGFFFLMDDDEDLSQAAWGKHRSKTVAMALATQLIWKHKGYLAPIAFGLVFFGLVGIGCLKRDLDQENSLLLAATMGVLVSVLMFTFAFQMERKPDRNAPVRAVVGQNATVVKTIPGHRSGFGKVGIEVDGQCQEFEAVTNSEEIPLDAEVVVTVVASSRMLEVKLSGDHEFPVPDTDDGNEEVPLENA